MRPSLVMTSWAKWPDGRRLHRVEIITMEKVILPLPLPARKHIHQPSERDSFSHGQAYLTKLIRLINKIRVAIYYSNKKSVIETVCWLPVETVTPSYNHKFTWLAQQEKRGVVSYLYWYWARAVQCFHLHKWKRPPKRNQILKIIHWAKILSPLASSWMDTAKVCPMKLTLLCL